MERSERREHSRHADTAHGARAEVERWDLTGRVRSSGFRSVGLGLGFGFEGLGLGLKLRV